MLEREAQANALPFAGDKKQIKNFWRLVLGFLPVQATWGFESVSSAKVPCEDEMHLTNQGAEHAHRYNFDLFNPSGIAERDCFYAVARR